MFELENISWIWLSVMILFIVVLFLFDYKWKSKTQKLYFSNKNKTTMNKIITDNQIQEIFSNSNIK